MKSKMQNIKSTISQSSLVGDTRSNFKAQIRLTFVQDGINIINTDKIWVKYYDCMETLTKFLLSGLAPLTRT